VYLTYGTATWIIRIHWKEKLVHDRLTYVLLRTPLFLSILYPSIHFCTCVGWRGEAGEGNIDRSNIDCEVLVAIDVGVPRECHRPFGQRTKAMVDMYFLCWAWTVLPGLSGNRVNSARDSA